MEWLPIEKYDKLKKKPGPFVVFLAAEEPGKLPQAINLSRHMGFRTITHFCVLPKALDSSEKA